MLKITKLEGYWFTELKKVHLHWPILTLTMKISVKYYKNHEENYSIEKV